MACIMDEGMHNSLVIKGWQEVLVRTCPLGTSRPLTATLASAKSNVEFSVGREPGKLRSQVDTGSAWRTQLSMASGMHTCLHKSSPPEQAALPLRERKRERVGGEGALPGPAPQLPALA